MGATIAFTYGGCTTSDFRSWPAIGCLNGKHQASLVSAWQKYVQARAIIEDDGLGGGESDRSSDKSVTFVTNGHLVANVSFVLAFVYPSSSGFIGVSTSCGISTSRPIRAWYKLVLAIFCRSGRQCVTEAEPPNGTSISRSEPWLLALLEIGMIPVPVSQSAAKQLLDVLHLAVSTVEVRKYVEQDVIEEVFLHIQNLAEDKALMSVNQLQEYVTPASIS
ncbi:hypothetical protein V9T40_004745 [Parthenolecanium corni]|uniref:Uncharacterized protein n=1 Tax=Parthenolecanium corni TaxID=536013 RepID=A0AAN9TQU9_9HEMI